MARWNWRWALILMFVLSLLVAWLFAGALFSDDGATSTSTPTMLQERDASRDVTWTDVRMLKDRLKVASDVHKRWQAETRSGISGMESNEKLQKILLGLMSIGAYETQTKTCIKDLERHLADYRQSEAHASYDRALAFLKKMRIGLVGAGAVLEEK